MAAEREPDAAGVVLDVAGAAVARQVGRDLPADAPGAAERTCAGEAQGELGRSVEAELVAELDEQVYRGYVSLECRVLAEDKRRMLADVRDLLRRTWEEA